MLYPDIHEQLKTAFEKMNSVAEPDNLGLRIRKRTFQSSVINNDSISPVGFRTSGKTETHNINNELKDFNDCDIESNRAFDYYTFENIAGNKSSGVIFLFHGLNEKKWEKYLPWAYQLTKLTGKTVILFPIAFHMNRAPSAWSDARLMQRLAAERAGKLTNSHSSFANAALSERLDSHPQRFFMSGFQTYNDFCDIIKFIRAGEISGIQSNAGIDLFGYSIGAFFSLLLMMDNPANMLGDARLFMFCGGATYDKTFPVSKYIVDKRASSSVTFHFEELLKDKPRAINFLDYYFEKFSLRQSYFPGIMNYERFKDLRERRLKQIHERINVIALEKDDVIIPREIISSLCGDSGTVKPHVEVMDFDFSYNHVTPFPLMEKNKQGVDKAFKCVMEKASGFLV